MIKGNCWIFGWHSVTPQRLECKTARREIYHSWFDHYWLALFRIIFIFPNMSFKPNLVIFRGIWRKWKQEDSRYFQFIEKFIINIGAVWSHFSSKTVAALSSKPFAMADIADFSTEAKDTCTCVNQRCSGNFIGAEGLLGIFAYICRQRPVIHCIHWWRWRSGARQLDTNGVDAAKIQLELIEFQ